jgi:hypothetical protein
MSSTRSPFLRVSCSSTRVIGMDAGPTLPNCGKVVGTRLRSSFAALTIAFVCTEDTWWVM